MLQVRGLAVEVAGRLLVEDVSFTIRAREKVGLVGRNGAGKTSLLRVIGGAAPPTPAWPTSTATSGTCRRTRSSTAWPTT